MRRSREEERQQKRDEFAARTRVVEIPDGVRLEVVKTPDGLWFGKTEVTRAQWNAVMNAPSGSSRGGTRADSGLPAPVLAKLAERGISDEQIATLMSMFAAEEGMELDYFRVLKVLFANAKSTGTGSQFLDGEMFASIVEKLEKALREKESDFPVVNVTPDGCARFIKALNALPATKAAGLRFRLPTVSEWRKASLAGGKPPFGLTFMGDEANICDVGWIQAPELHLVAQRQPNAWGLYDMFGNVREFVKDNAAIRAYGGSFRTQEQNLRQDELFTISYGSKADDLGLRLCAEESK